MDLQPQVHMSDQINPYQSPKAVPTSSPTTPQDRGVSLRTGIICSAAITLLYWAWESQAGGNIRVDLVLGYPLLFGLYLYFLQRIGWASLPAALALMLLNYCFFMASYSLFDKPLG